jgi:RHS repeat-associated protein
VLANTYVYDSFGNLTNSSGTVTNPYQYTGRDYDPETGLRYYRAGYYDPASGRFISEDPIGFRAGINMFEYVHNNPTNSIDPSGKQTAQKNPFCERDGTCSIHLTCLPTHGTEFTHCDVTTRNGHFYTTYGAGPKGGTSIWWGGTLDAGKVAPEGKGNPPTSQGTYFYTLFPCDKLNCVAIATERIHQAKLPYSAFLINSNTAAHLMLKACGLGWVSFPSEAWGANTPLWLFGRRF